MVMVAISAAVGVFSAVEQRKASKKAAQASKRQQQVSARRSQRQAMRQAQIQKAQMRAQGEAMGMSGGSALSGAFGGLSSNLGAALGYSSQQTALSGIIGDQTAAASKYSGLSNMGFGMMNLGLKYGGLDGIKNQLNYP
tara:strand:+ start:173 stop:589 length:417 start_codon:yes stop_codon:yes gene_type:complete